MFYGRINRLAWGLMLGLALIILSGLVPPDAGAARGGAALRREGEVLVKMKASTGFAAATVSEAAVSDLARTLRGFKARKLRSSRVIPGLYALTLNPGEKVEDKVLELMSNPDVELAQPNYLYHASVVPDDPSFGKQWDLLNAVNPGVDMHMPEAWDVTTGSAGVVVGVIDTGIDYLHPDLAPNLWVNPVEVPGDGVDNDGDGYVDDLYGINAITGSGDPADDDGHGTHVSGTIGAVGNNGSGVTGVNWNVRIMALKFLDNTGTGSTSDAIECINYAVRMKQAGVNIRVLNNSWGGSPGDPDDPALEQAISSAGANDILFVVAAGNEGNDNDFRPTYPASSPAPNVMAVAATDDTDTLASWSNYGVSSVAVAAPGVGIFSTWPGGTYKTESGTSMAAPHVSGLAALILSHSPGMNVTQLKAAIMDSVDKIGGMPVASGGRVNAAAALNVTVANPLTLSESQDGGSTTLKAVYKLEGVPQYGKKINFYQDGVLAGSGTTGAAGTSTAGAASVTFAGTPGRHTASAALDASSGGLSVKSADLVYVTALPAVTQLNPGQASVGAVVTITGTDFGTTKPGSVLMLINGKNKKVKPLTWANDSITFKVPKLKSGMYTLSVVNILGASGNTSLDVPNPHVGSVSPTTVAPGAQAQLSGQFFGLKGKLQLLRVNALKPIKAKAVSWSDTAITFLAPPKALGDYSVTVSNSSGISGPSQRISIVP